MKTFSKIALGPLALSHVGLAAALAVLAAPALAQETLDPMPGHDRERGEFSPGTEAPTAADLEAAIGNVSPERLFGMLEYGERVECPGCMPLLEEQILTSSDARVREISAWWIRRHPFGFAAVFRDMRAVLAEDGDSVRRARAAEAIGEFMDWHGVEYLTAAVSTDSAVEVRVAAVRGLGRINAPGAVTGIVAAFEDDDASVRRAAIEQVAIVNFYREFDPLIGRLGDDDAGVRRAAALQLANFGGQVADAVPALSAMVVGDEDVMVRQAAAYTLGRIGTADAAAALREARDLETERAVLDAITVALRM
jgi:hypothetical protein